MANILASILKTATDSHAVQAIIIGAVLAWFTLEIFAWIKASKVNGWITIFGCGVPGNGMLLRAACTKIFPGPINVPQEAMYWTSTKDGTGHKLNGRHNYIMHFPPGGLPSNDAFWSLTMGDAKQRYVPNPLNRYSVCDHSGLVPNPDGSVDIYIQHTAPVGHESNWLPSPIGYFIPWLRVYQPGEAILNGTYQVPPIVKAQVQGVADRERWAILDMIYSHPIALAIVAVLAWVVYRQFSLAFAEVAVIAWAFGTFLLIYFLPRLILNVYKRAILVKGFGEGPVPINTLYTTPQNFFQTLLSGKHLRARIQLRPA